jgi:hypothetical protein
MAVRIATAIRVVVAGRRTNKNSKVVQLQAFSHCFATAWPSTQAAVTPLRSLAGNRVICQAARAHDGSERLTLEPANMPVCCSIVCQGAASVHSTVIWPHKQSATTSFTSYLGTVGTISDQYEMRMVLSPSLGLYQFCNGSINT